MKENNGELRIYLIRHAKPDVSRSGFFNHKQAEQFIRDYDIANIIGGIGQPDNGEFTDIPHVYASTLNRSRQSAKLLFGEKIPIREFEHFREFQSRIIKFPFLHLPIGFWLFISRLLWFLGFNDKGIESYQEGRKRAKKAAEILDKDAVIHKKAVLVAHGFLNIFIKRELEKLGWKVFRKGGRGFLSITGLNKSENANTKTVRTN